jgi:hypothetical protein
MRTSLRAAVAVLVFAGLPAGADSGLHLDNGAKWPADKPTVAAITAMQATVATFAKSGNGEFDELAWKLKGQLDGLIRDCRMTGPAHDQLHVFIKLLAPRIADLQSDDPVKIRMGFERVDALLAQFDDYFEAPAKAAAP